MSKKWEATHTATDGTPLMLEDGRYYTQWAWDNFCDAYRGEAREIKRAKLLGSDADWGSDEVTAEMDDSSPWANAWPPGSGYSSPLGFAPDRSKDYDPDWRMKYIGQWIDTENK